MRIDERIVVHKPKSIQLAKKKRQNTWTRRAILFAFWDLRRRILKEQGEDILQLFTMTDCIEISLRGEIETLPNEAIKRKLQRKKEQIEE